jgi:hypothetical protein
VIRFHLLGKVLDKREGGGFRCGFCFGIPVLGQRAWQILEAPAAPFLANLPGQTTGTVDCYLKGL